MNNWTEQLRDPRAVVPRLDTCNTHLLHPFSGCQCSRWPRQNGCQVRVWARSHIPQCVHGPGPGRCGYGSLGHSPPGTVKCYHRTDAEFEELAAHFPDFKGKRQIFDVKVEMVQTSCGYAVPFYEFKEERTRLVDWSEKKENDEDWKAYWTEKNSLTIDGKPTGIKM